MFVHDLYFVTNAASNCRAGGVNSREENIRNCGKIWVNLIFFCVVQCSDVLVLHISVSAVELRNVRNFH